MIIFASDFKIKATSLSGTVEGWCRLGGLDKVSEFDEIRSAEVSSFNVVTERLAISETARSRSLSGTAIRPSNLSEPVTAELIMN